MERFLISGYWKDDSTEFEDYLVVDTDEVQPDDTVIFMYGITEEEIQEVMIGNISYEFEITSYTKQ